MNLRSSLLVAFLFLTAVAANAQILLTVDDSDPADVTITATGNNPLNDYPYVNNYVAGVALSGFFAGGLASSYTYSVSSLSTTLTAGTGGPGSQYYDTAGSGLYINGEPYNYLLLQGLHGSGLLVSNEYFWSGLPAFSGAASFDFSDTDAASLLPAVGSSGEIVVGGLFNTGSNDIGQWEVISTPEPRSWSLILLAVCAFFYLRYRMKFSV